MSIAPILLIGRTQARGAPPCLGAASLGRLLPVLFLPCFWAEIDPMDNRDLKIELLTILAVGCKKHPAYRAFRLATGRCEPCVRTWQA